MGERPAPHWPGLGFFYYMHWALPNAGCSQPDENRCIVSMSLTAQANPSNEFCYSNSRYSESGTEYQVDNTPYSATRYHVLLLVVRTGSTPYYVVIQVGLNNRTALVPNNGPGPTGGASGKSSRAVVSTRRVD